MTWSKPLITDKGFNFTCCSHNRPEIQDALQPSSETLVADDIAEVIAYMDTLPRLVALLYFDRKANLGATSPPARA